MRRVIMGLARTYPLTSLSLLLSLSVELAALWLQFARHASSHADPRGLAIVNALGILGLVLSLPMMWTIIGMIPLRDVASAPQAYDDEWRQSLSLPLLARIAQRPIRWQLVRYVAWGVLLVLALGRVIVDFTSDLGLGDVLAIVVLILYLVEFVGVFMVRFSSVQRYG